MNNPWPFLTKLGFQAELLAGGPDNFLLGLQSMSLKLCRVVAKPLHPIKKTNKKKKKKQIKHVQLKSMNATQTVQGCPSSGVGLRKDWNVCPAAAVNKIDKEADYQLFRSSAF